VARLNDKELDFVKRWLAKCEEEDFIPTNGITIGNLLDTIEAQQQEIEKLKHGPSPVDYCLPFQQENTTLKNALSVAMEALDRISNWFWVGYDGDCGTKAVADKAIELIDEALKAGDAT